MFRLRQHISLGQILQWRKANVQIQARASVTFVTAIEEREIGHVAPVSSTEAKAATGATTTALC